MKDGKSRNAILFRLLRNIGSLLINLSNKLEEDSPETTEALTSIALLLEKAQNSVLRREEGISKTGGISFDRRLFPNKESIIDFVKDNYGERVPKNLKRNHIEKRALEIMAKGGVEKFNEAISRMRTQPVPVLEVWKMSEEDLRKELNKLPNARIIREAIPRELRRVIKGVTRKETAIERIIREVNAIKIGHLGKIEKIFK